MSTVSRKPLQGPAHAQEITAAANLIRSNVRARLEEERKKGFISSADLEEIWGGIVIIKAVLKPQSFSWEQLETIRRKLLKVLSIFIIIDGSHYYVERFKDIFVEKTRMSRSIRDSEIPIPRETCHEYLKPELAEHFKDAQYFFNPAIIQEDHDSLVQRIDMQRPLPFVAGQLLGKGAFGIVDAVRIPAGCLQDKDGQPSRRAQVFARKHFWPRADFSPENSNLKMLKGCSTPHEHVMLHMAMILHMDEMHILFPLATSFDLGVFLREGIDADGSEVKYTFKHRFQSEKMESFLHDLLDQCKEIAGALKWLHHGIKGRGFPNGVFCVHMDLKPSNILVTREEKCTVGHWMLSDFGISVFETSNDKSPVKSSRVLSTSDYVLKTSEKAANLRANTIQQRLLGPYTAPDLAVDELGIGRKSDVWSFGCIVSEVLAFGLGRAALVNDFKQARRGHRSTGVGDRWYTRADHAEDGLAPLPNDTRKTFVVKPQVISFLEGLEARFHYGNGKSVECAVRTILGILDVSCDQRPDSKATFSRMEHVCDHFRDFKHHGGANCSSLTAANAAQKGTVGSDAHTSGRNVAIPAILTPADGGETSTIGVREFSPRSAVTSYDRTAQNDTNILGTHTFTSDDRGREAARNTGGTRPGTEGRVERQPVAQHTTTPSQSTIVADGRIANGRTADGRTADERVADGRIAPPHSPYSDAGSSTTHRRTANLPAPQNFDLVHQLLGRTKVFDFALNCTTTLLAYLIKGSAIVFQLGDGTVEPTEKVTCQLPLCKSCGQFDWSKIVLNDQFLVAWGTCSKSTSKKICVYNLMTKGCGMYPVESTLKEVALSRLGALAFVYGKKIGFSSLGQIDPSKPHDEHKVAREYGQFHHGAFNSVGTCFFAWESGQSIDCLYVWHVNGEKIFKIPFSMTPFTTSPNGSSQVTLSPYSIFPSVLVEKVHSSFFLASPRESSAFHPIKPYVTLLNGVLAYCTLGAHTLIVLEDGRHTKLQQHSLLSISRESHNSERVIIPSDLKGLPKEKPKDLKMQAIQRENNVLLVICTIRCAVSFIPVFF